MRDLAEVVEAADVANDAVFLAILAERHFAERRLERQPVDEQAIEIVVLHRERLDREIMEGNKLLQALGILLGEFDEVVAQALAEFVAGGGIVDRLEVRCGAAGGVLSDASGHVRSLRIHAHPSHRWHPGG